MGITWFFFGMRKATNMISSILAHNLMYVLAKFFLLI